MMRERFLPTMMMKAMKTITSPSLPTSCPTRATTRLDMDATNADMTFVQRAGRFRTIVVLLQTPGVSLQSSDHVVMNVEEDFANVLIIIEL